MTTKHLAGPWSIGFQPVPFSELVGSEEGWVELSSPEHTGFALFVWRMEDDERSPELEATVRAASAAPELLEALEKRAQVDAAYVRLAMSDVDPDTHERLLQQIEDAEDAAKDAARAAIAKAKGEQA